MPGMGDRSICICRRIMYRKPLPWGQPHCESQTNNSRVFWTRCGRINFWRRSWNNTPAHWATFTLLIDMRMLKLFATGSVWSVKSDTLFSKR